MLHIAKSRAPLVYTWPLPTVTAGLPWQFDVKVWDIDGVPATLDHAVFSARICDPGTDYVLATGTASVPEAGVVRVQFASGALTSADTMLHRFTLDVALPGLTQRLVDSCLPVRAGQPALADIPVDAGPGPGPPIEPPPDPLPPAPVLTGISPASAVVGAASMVLTCTGSDFTVASVIWFDGRALATTFVSATTLQATINPATYSAARAVNVQVADNRGQGSAILTFSLTAAPIVLNPPVLTSISPTSVTLGSAPAVLVCTGSTFSATSVVWFNGVALATTFVNTTTIQATINPSAFSVPQAVSVQVKNADGQVSAVLNLFLTAAPVLPDPVLSLISPTTAVVGSANFTLTCTGTGSTFTNASVIWFNGAPLTTTFIDFDHLTATVQSSLETVAGTRTVQVRDSSHVSAILTFTYTAAVETGIVSFFSAGAVSGSDAVDTTAQSLGLRIDPLVNGALTSISYWRNSAAANAEGWVGVWHRDGTLLQSVEFTDHAGTGWRTVPFRLRYPMLSSDAYVAGVWLRPNGSGQTFYKAQSGRFTAAGLTISGQLTAPPDNSAVTRSYAQKNGLYVHNSADNDIMMPVNSFSGGNYWVDVGWLAGTYPTVPLGTYPNARNTGHSGALTPISGEQELNTAGMTYANKDVNGKLFIKANNITVQNCRIRAGAGMVGADGVIIISDGVTGTKIYDCTIDGQNTSDGIKGIWGAGDIRRCNIFGCEDGIYMKSGTNIFQDNYVHGLRADGNPSPHKDCVSIDNPMTGAIIKHNTLRNGIGDGVGCVNITNQAGAVADTVIEDNICEGGTYQIFTDNRMGPGAITNTIVKDNVHINGSWQYGLYATFGTSPPFVLSGATIVKPPPAGYFD